MGRQVDYIRSRFGPLKDKTLKNALMHEISSEFPRIGGTRVVELCADMLLNVMSDHLHPREHMTHGQILWTGISVDDPPRRNKRTRDAVLVPALLDLSKDEDIDRRIDRVGKRKLVQLKAVRLCEQAYEQGALLSNSDLAEILTEHDSTIASLLAAHERQTGRLVPRRATLHDVGTGMTHKRIICRKRYGEGKGSDQVARETYHSMEAVDRYLAQYDRVRHCRLQGFSPQETAYTLNCSLGLVKEYLEIDDELGGQTD